MNVPVLDAETARLHGGKRGAATGDFSPEVMELAREAMRHDPALVASLTVRLRSERPQESSPPLRLAR